MTIRRIFAVILGLVVSTAVGDVIVMKSGEKLTGKVTRFEHGQTSLANSRFVVDVGGKEQDVPLFKVESVTFGGGPSAQGSTATTVRPFVVPASPPASPRASITKPSDTKSGDYWLSSTGKRHNSSCRYYKSSKGRPCGATDGVACKTCGG